MIDLKKISLFLVIFTAYVDAYQIDGTLDRSYAKGQQMNEQLPICKAVAMQADGKMLVAGYVETPGKKTFAVARLLANGVLDQSFGNNGRVQTVFSNVESASSAQAIMIDSQGRIVAGGFTNGINNLCHACLARYNADGSLDKSFFGGRGIFKGTVITTFGSIEETSHISAITETKDQNIVAVGSVQENHSVCFAVAQYKPTGALDLNFNAGRGMVCTQFDSSNQDEAVAVTIDSHDKIVVAGSSYASGIKTFALARYHKDGSLDQSFFGGNTRMHGIVITNFMCGETEGQARAVCVQDDGKILAAGYTNAWCAGHKSTQFALARYTAQGMLDESFKGDKSAGVPGTVVTHFGDAQTKSAINALLLQADGKVVAGGFAQINNEKYFALARYESDGSCDYTFNGGGAPNGTVLSRAASHTNDEIFGLAFALPGDIIAVGRCKSKTFCCGAVARYLCEQDLDCPVIDTPCNEQVIVDGSAVRVKGNCQKTSRIQIYLDEKMVNTVSARSNRWEYTLPPLASGYHSLRVCERYDAGNIILHSNAIRILVDQHPIAINQTIECQGMRSAKGCLAARGASGEYSFKIVNEKNCHVCLTDRTGAFSVEATVPAGNASFDFEAQDSITGCISRGSVSIIVKEIPVTSPVSLEMPQNNKLTANLQAFTIGGQKPYLFQLMEQCSGCVLQPEGMFSFQPEPEFTGITDFQFIVTDKYSVTSDPGQVSIQVHPMPRALEYTIHAFSNTQIAGQVNQCAVDGRAPYIFYASQIQEHCSIIMEQDGSFICIPAHGCPKHISFEYTIFDDRGYSSKPCHVSLCLHDILEIKQAHFLGFKNCNISNDLNRFVTKGSAPYIFALEQQSVDGTATVHSDGSFEFVPRKDFVGNTFFTVKIHDSNAHVGIGQIAKIALEIKQMSDFHATPLHLYVGMKKGDLKNAIECYPPLPFKLVGVPQGIAVELNANGEFSFEVQQEYDNQVEFMYDLLDSAGKGIGMKHAQIIFHKYPVAHSAVHEVMIGQPISGNLNELISEGMAPFSYEVVSTTNGKIVCQPDGSYTFKPRFDLVGNAEFAYRATDVNNQTSNIAKVQFHWPLMPGAENKQEN